MTPEEELNNMQLELTTDEIAVLTDVLDSGLRELREEIYKAEVADYKVSLKRRETILISLLARLGGQVSV